MTRRVTRTILNRPIKKQSCKQRKGLLLPKRIINEWEKQRTGSNYPSFRGNISSPFAIATAKPCMYQRKLNESWTSWWGKSVSREQAFQDMWSRCFENISTNTKMMWKDGGNSEVLHSSNASLRRVTVFGECSNTAWAYNPIFYISKVCLCTTNCRLYHKDPCPERGIKSLQSRD